MVMLAISRNRSAPFRNKPSRACRSIFPLMTFGDVVLDYGCGQGFDTDFLQSMGFEVTGYDPYFPDRQIKGPADWVLLFYVLNVIEDLAEREYVLLDAYRLAGKGLAVGVTPQERVTGREVPYGDGRITIINTFYTSYDWPRVQRYIRAVLGLQPIREDAVLWMPSTSTPFGCSQGNPLSDLCEPFAHFELSRPELRKRMGDYQEQINQLRRSDIWCEDCTLQPFQTRGIRRYRVFSDSGQANGKRYLYAGTGEPWGWVMDRFVNRDKLEILQDRLQYCREVLHFDSG